MKVVIRPPKPGDAAGLAIAARDLAEQYSELEPDRFHVPESGEQIASYQEALRKPIPEHRVWLVAEVNGEAVGEAQATIHEPMADAGVQPLRDMGRCRVYLNYLAVQAAHRSHGIGGRLLNAVEDWARKNGAELMQTGTNLRTDAGAIRFYERHGFERQSIILRKLLA